MKGYLLAAILFLPLITSAATIGAEKNVTLSIPPADNTYLAGKAVTIEAPVAADLSVVGVTVSVAAPVEGDALLIGGTVDQNSAVTGDVRTLGGRVSITGNTGGDLVAFGGRVSSLAAAHTVLIIGGSIHEAGSSTGPVELYGADISLDGTYAGDVTVVATDRFTLGPNAHISGTLRYSAPQQLSIPPSAKLEGGAIYTGSFQYVPTNQEAKTYALFGIGIFFIVRALGAMIVAGLIIGLLPVWSSTLMNDLLAITARRSLLAFCIGAVWFVAIPFGIVLLLASFAGASLAFMLGAAYVLFGLGVGAYAGAYVGALLRTYIFSRFRGTTEFTWRDAIAGALVLSIIGTLPYVGLPIHLIFVLVVAGSILVRIYRFIISNNH